MSEHEDTNLVREVENFLIIFALVCLVSWFIRLLCRPFKGIGWRGWLAGFFAVPLLLLALIGEGLSFAYAGTDYVIEEATVKAPVANVRSTPSAGNNIVGQLHKGDKLGKVQWHDNTWIAILHPTDAAVYIHNSTLQIRSKKIMLRGSAFDIFMAFAGTFYALCAIGAWQQRKRQEQIKIPAICEKDMDLLPLEYEMPQDVKVVYKVRALPAPIDKRLLPR